MFLVTLMRVPCQKTEQVSFLGLARFYEIASVGYAATSSEPQNMGRPTLFRKACHLPKSTGFGHFGKNRVFYGKRVLKSTFWTRFGTPISPKNADFWHPPIWRGERPVFGPFSIAFRC